MDSHDNFSVEQRLATYGTLAPGRPNAHILGDVEGTWTQGTIRGHLEERGWGATSGYPGINLAEDGLEVEVHLFTSSQLPNMWEKLDSFEGEEYHRTVAKVRTADGEVEAYIYTLAPSNPVG